MQAGNIGETSPYFIQAKFLQVTVWVNNNWRIYKYEIIILVGIKKKQQIISKSISIIWWNVFCWSAVSHDKDLICLDEY